MVEFLGQFCERSPTDTELEDYMMLLGDLGSFSMYTLINSGSKSIPLYQQQGGTGMGILTYGLNLQFGVSEPEHRVSWQGKHSPEYG